MKTYKIDKDMGTFMAGLITYLWLGYIISFTGFIAGKTPLQNITFFLFGNVAIVICWILVIWVKTEGRKLEDEDAIDNDY